MVQLKTLDVQALIKDLSALSQLSKEVDERLTSELHEMTPQLENDNYGTGDITKRSQLATVIKNMDKPDKVSELSESLIGGLEMVIKNI